MRGTKEDHRQLNRVRLTFVLVQAACYLAVATSFGLGAIVNAKLNGPLATGGEVPTRGYDARPADLLPIRNAFNFCCCLLLDAARRPRGNWTWGQKGPGAVGGS